MKKQENQPYDIVWSNGNPYVKAYYLGAELEKKLLFAAEKGNLEEVKNLLNKNIPIDIKNSFGETILMIAAKYGHINLMNFLIEKNANLEAQNNVGMTALILAASFGKLDSVSLLLDKGANIDATDGYNRTALKAAASKSQVEVVEFLVYDKKCKVPEDVFRFTAFDYQSNNEEDYNQVRKIFAKELNIDLTTVGYGDLTGFTIHLGNYPGTFLNAEAAKSIKNDIIYQDQENIPKYTSIENQKIIDNSECFIIGTLLGKMAISPGISYLKDHVNNVNLNIPVSKYYIDNIDSICSFKSLAMLSTSTLAFSASNFLGNSVANSFIISKVVSDTINGNYNKNTQEYAIEMTCYLAKMLTSSVVNIILLFPHHNKHPIAVTTTASVMPNLIELAGSVAYRASTEGYKASIDLYNQFSSTENLIGNTSDNDLL